MRTNDCFVYVGGESTLGRGKMFCWESLAVRFVPPKMAGRSCTLQNEGWLLLSRGYRTFHGSHELSINFFAGNWFPRHLLYLNVIKGETVRTLTEESCSQFSWRRLSRRGATAALLYRCDSQETKISYHYLNKLSSFPRVKNRWSSVLLEISRCQVLVLRFQDI